MKTSKTGNVTYYVMKDIASIATNIINDYVNDGYIMNIGTMAGSQGDNLKVDLAKDGNTVRIRIFEENVSGPVDNTVILETRIYKGYDFSSGHSASILWNHDGEELTSRKFYAVSNCRYSSREDTFYVDDEEEAHRVEAVRHQRMMSKSQLRSIKSYHMTSISPDKVIGIIKSRQGYKRTKVSDIGPVYRFDGHYYAELDRLPSKSAERVVKLA